MSSENVRLGRSYRLRLLCPSCVSFLPEWRAFSQAVLAYGVSVNAKLASDRPEGKASEYGLLHIPPQTSLTRSGYSVLLCPGLARPQVPGHLFCFQCARAGVPMASRAVNAAGQSGALRRGGVGFPQQGRRGQGPEHQRGKRHDRSRQSPGPPGGWMSPPRRGIRGSGRAQYHLAGHRATCPIIPVIAHYSWSSAVMALQPLPGSPFSPAGPGSGSPISWTSRQIL